MEMNIFFLLTSVSSSFLVKTIIVMSVQLFSICYSEAFTQVLTSQWVLELYYLPYKEKRKYVKGLYSAFEQLWT